jgi:hypothetical protein
MKNKAPIAIVFLAAVLSGCQSPDVIRMSSDTYLISKSSGAGAFTDRSKLKVKVVSQANEFAESHGKVVEPISLSEKVPAFGFPSVDYQFRLVDPKK